ncbi:FKBP-type peptidyl-prolyl isomerase-like protein [Rhodothalassium salexigens DSM 2132]|uniref:Peptidyl-prolyl cis-trans isomerase n=1 Tax=Rhodothalassium salexigens DSM 2132 TaxID=1188247 RepID=A0A4R2PIA4_RHOSA|nr:FKBP-type peptidyl-prolyl cis-trans isomerase [Rhodothalassium salexigens]MBB4211267.1 FKBP-type peptidyl-prolyl cis-trans isomerase [Rhodothalassium salexigens DSM 2132]MBK1639591.1 hypothetical protein [Rhodothalassium salexigens DSM 2132]TCP35189.1 FKBP-type peptidyl-prolyl isomerase-like protein [Rhodothalassium salexigens DSM 2132]
MHRRPLIAAALVALLPALAACDKPADDRSADATAPVEPTATAGDDAAVSKAYAELMEMGTGDMTQDRAFLKVYAQRDDVIRRDSGLLYRVIEEGDGATPEPGAMVRVHYRGQFIDGSEFDSSYSRGEPAVFPSDRLIAGWVEALALMQEGDTWELVVPADLGYGAGGKGKIPGGATLVFQVSLLDVVSQPGG